MEDGHSYSEVWRRYEEHPLTHSMAHYLLAISELREERGYARATDVAKRLGVTKGSASIALKTMREKGLITEDENRMLLLTERGISAVGNIVSARSTFLRFFHEILAIDENAALEDACKLEHLVSRMTSERLTRFIHFLMLDPVLKKHVEAFTNNVTDCGRVDTCTRCNSIDECTEKLLSPKPKKTKAKKKPKARS